MNIDHTKASLNTLCHLREAADLRIRVGCIRRDELDAEIAKRMTQTGPVEIAEHFEIAVDTTPRYNMDWAKWAHVKKGVAEHFRPTRWVEAISMKSLAHVRDHYPAEFAVIATAMTIEPRIKVKVTEIPPVSPTVERKQHHGN